MSSEWVDRVETAPKPTPAGQLYCGRAITETRQAAAHTFADVFFLSAGLGLVGYEQFVPAYNLTASSGTPDSIEERLTEPYRPELWWRSLLAARKAKGVLTRFFHERSSALMLIAMPPGYLQMISEELRDLPKSVRAHLRVLGPRRAEEVPDHLREQWMPYDDRLDDPRSGFNGTTADFPHRALCHFATQVLDGQAGRPAQAHRERVERSLAGLRPYVRPRGAGASDEQLLELIGKLWTSCNGNRGRVLRTLRSERGIACEQGRFRRLADQFEGKC